MSEKVITSYKAFDKNMQCRGFQYEVGKEYEMDGEIKCCKQGFHACKSPMEVWDYYDMLNSRYAVVEQSGKIDAEDRLVHRATLLRLVHRATLLRLVALEKIPLSCVLAIVQ